MSMKPKEKWEQEEITKEWSEFKQFKDPVYGYIPVSRPYVKYLIDTQMMQRIKGVAQTGLRPVFSSATHDRFSHSLGVYKFAMAMYDSFEEKLLIDVQYLFEKWGTASIIAEKLHRRLKHWKTLLAIACFLHDIGHPVQSHGFEFLYDDPYLDVEYVPDGEPLIVGNDDETFSREQDRVFSLLKEIKHDEEKTPEGNLRKNLVEAFQSFGDYRVDSVPGSPHERMSAYYILKDEKLQANIIKLIRSSREMVTLDSDNEEEIRLDICFIARMIIGLEYTATEQVSFNKDAFFNSIKNCVIHILNGKLDADGIDYLMRNSYTAGYDTSKIDSTRLCKAYTAYEKNYVMFPAFSKSALSVLEGYIAARNFEPKWLYSHHKVVYADLLTKRIYKFITRYLTDQTLLVRSVKAFLKHAKKSALVFDQDQDFGSDLMLIPTNKPMSASPADRISLNAQNLLAHMEQWSYPFYTYLLAPCRKYTIYTHHFNKTADADMDALIHWMSNELAAYKSEPNSQERYKTYTDKLKKHVVDSLTKDSENALDINALRILLAETCVGIMVTADQNPPVFMRSWAICGDTEAALKELEFWKGHSSDKDRVRDILQSTRGANAEELLKLWLNQYQPLLILDDFTEFFDLLDEYETRSYRRSLWKSYPEYRLFIKDCAHELGYSFDDVDRYMVKLIREGMREHGFSIFEGKKGAAVKNPPELYKEQFFYQQDGQAESGNKKWYAESSKSHGGKRTPGPALTGKDIAQQHADIIFSKKKYDFSRTKLVVTFYRIKHKEFKNIHLLFENRPVPLEDVFSTGGKGGVFPYFYYLEDDITGGYQSVLRAFQSDFINYCRDYRKSEVGSDSVKMGKNQILRDAVYGDIEIPQEFYAVVCTREFQRLGRIRQLATADRVFPNATHTRLAHSIGTWHVMRLILRHFKQKYQANPQMEFTAYDENILLLAALLHDLGHGPYSHVLENALDKPHYHEEMTRSIISDESTEISAVIKRFGSNAVDDVCNLLDDKADPNGRGISLMYHTLISGPLDADRIDYLLRDNSACGMSFGHIDLQQLIDSMLILPVYDDSGKVTDYKICYDRRYLSAIDQFIYARFQMYRNVYYAPVKMLYEEIIKQIFLQAFHLHDEIKPNEIYEILKKIKYGNNPKVSEYISLDDESMNGLIKQWASGDILNDVSSASEKVRSRKDILQKLSQALLDHHVLYERVDLGGNHKLYDLLAKRVTKYMKCDCDTFHSLLSGPNHTSFDEEYSAFIFVQGEVHAYKKNAENGKGNITLQDLEDGTTDDYINRSIFCASIDAEKRTLMRTDYVYLFFSKGLLKKDCMIHGLSGREDEIVKIVESSKPRKHIEIEKKYYCTAEQLEVAEKHLRDNYTEATVEKKEQTDYYYNCFVDGKTILPSEQFSFRCRKASGKHLFTLKTPVDSPNYDSASEFARYEYEIESSDEKVDDVIYEFLTDTLTACEKGELVSQLSQDNLNVQLIIHNNRTVIRLDGKCEICLDSVQYETPDHILLNSKLYQIEIELLDDPEKWAQLVKEVIDPLTTKLGDSLISTTESKLKIGLQLLSQQS